MEKKNIGTFIAALRKANGMTQRELAERLNVSDKTVSRWERDDGAPDLSLIPVIAELFGVTCDELLRGERKSSEARAAGESHDPAISPKGEKTIRRLLNRSLQRFRAQSLIALGVGAAGLIAAMIANFGFLRGYIGFFLGLAFYVAGGICQWIFTDRAWHAASEAAIDEDSTGAYRWRVFRLACTAFGLLWGMATITLPLLSVGDAYYGLTAGSWLLLAILYGGVAVVVGYIACCAVRAILLKRGMLSLPASALAILQHNLKLQRRTALITAIVLAVTLLAHAFVTEVWSAWNIAKPVVFTDYESFVAYMEQPNARFLYSESGTVAMEMAISPMDPVEVFTNSLTLADGTVVCTYLDLNEDVARLGYTEKDGSLLPIEVVTYSAVNQAQIWVDLRNAAFCLLYAAEIAAAFVSYFRRRQR